MTRRLIPAAVGFVLGLFSAFYIGVNGSAGLSGFVVLAVSAAVIGLLAMALRVRFRAWAMTFCAAFAVAAAYSGAYTAFKLLPLEELDGELCKVEGRVEQMTFGDRSELTINGKVNGIRARIIVYINGSAIGFGDEIRLTARVHKLTDSPYFRAREYYLPDGVMLRGSAEEIIEIIPKKAGIIGKIREYSGFVSQNLRRTAGEEAGELLAAMVTGDRTAFSNGLRLVLNRAGVGHLASVSGLHVSIVAAAVLLLSRRLRAPRWLSAIVVGVCAAGFIVFAGFRVSAVRAGIMLGVAVIGTVVRRKSDPLNTICFCALLMTLPNPYAAADSSLMLSLTGVFGAAVMSKGLTAAFGLRSKPAKALCASVCASFAAAPFAALWFDEISLLSPVTNLFAIPLCSAALVLGMIYAALGCTVSILAEAAGALCNVVIRLCQEAAKLKIGYISVGDGWVSALLFAAAGVCILAWIITRKPRITALLTAALLSVSLAVISAHSALSQTKTQIFAMNYRDCAGLVLRRGGECIIIDFGGAARASETVISRFGVDRVCGAVLLSKGEAGYAEYIGLSRPPETVYLSENDYVFGGKIKTESLAAGSAIDIFDCNITVYDKSVNIIHQYGSASASNGSAAVGEGLKISFLGGDTVIENGEIFIYKGDILKKFELGRDHEWR